MKHVIPNLLLRRKCIQNNLLRSWATDIQRLEKALEIDKVDWQYVCYLNEGFTEDDRRILEDIRGLDGFTEDSFSWAKKRWPKFEAFFH